MSAQEGEKNMEQKFNDGYEIYGQEDKSGNAYNPMNYEESVRRRSQHKEIYSSSDNGTAFLEKVSRLSKTVTVLYLLIFSICFVLGYMTHGAVFFYDRTEAVITESNKDTSDYRTGKKLSPKSVLTITYNYGDKVYTIKSLTRYVRSNGDEVYVYVNKFGSHSAIFIDGGYGICQMLLAAACILVFLISPAVLIDNRHYFISGSSFARLKDLFDYYSH